MAAVYSASSDPRPPPLTQSDAVTSLLSLGLPASGNDNPAPIPISIADSTSSISSSTSNGILGLSQTMSTAGTNLGSSGVMIPSTSTDRNGKHHRRLGSSGKTRRRLSDAREASSRPHTQHSLLSLASLSLSTSPGALSSKPLAPRPSTATTPSGISITRNSTTPVAVLLTSSSSVSETTVKPEPSDKDRDSFSKTSSRGSTPIPITTNGKQKKRGVDYKCESCAKIYRHPNCLNKHRWEHTRQWREASKFVLSKHQQVQLLEAAAILSYMGAPSTSLPEDRSEWPTFLSGGSLPKAEPVGSSKDKESKASPASGGVHNNGVIIDSMPLRLNPLPLSTSVPIRMSASASHGPKMHDFTLPVSTTAGVGIGVLGPLSPNSLAQGRPSNTSGVNFPATLNGGKSFMRPVTPPLATNHNSSGMMAMAMDQPGWTSHIPSSSIRSESSASGSGSRSRSGSLSGSRSRSRSDGSELELEEQIEEEEDDVDLDLDVEIMDADAEDETVLVAVRDSVTRSTTKAYPTPYDGGYLDGSYGRHQSGGEYGSYTASSYGTANASNGTPGSFSGYSNRMYPHGPYLGVKQNDYVNDRSSASRALPHREEGGADMNQKNHNYERRWDGMEMEVDMDMD